jgi:hypothetical protein
MTLGDAAKAELHLIVWCRGCKHEVEPNSLNGTVPISRFWIGASGSSAPNAAAGI